MKDGEWLKFVVCLLALWLLAITMAFIFAGCAEAVIPVPVQSKANAYVVYYVVDMNAAACWVDHYDQDGRLVQHDLCSATPVLGGFAPTVTGAVAIGTAVGAIAK